MKNLPYVVIPAPGYYGDHGHVISRHASIRTAQAAANGKNRIVVHDPDGWLGKAGQSERGDVLTGWAADAIV